LSQAPSETGAFEKMKKGGAFSRRLIAEPQPMNRRA
jgi:hypothetical protein